MIEIGRRRRSQPPPPWVVYEALTEPDRDPTRPWLDLQPNEQRPTVLEAERPSLVVWSTLWPRHPEATIRFDLHPRDDGCTDLTWTLLVDAEPPPATVGHLRKRLNQLINADLRFTFGQ